jgi:membrane protein
VDTSPTSPESSTPAAPTARRDRVRASWRGCRRIVVAALRESVTDRVALAAAGCAYYATLALFPAISMLISVYGLAFNVQAVEQQLQVLEDLLPPPALALIDERVHQLVNQPSETLGISLIVSLVIALWSAAAGTKSALSAMNIAYDTTEQRGILGFQLIGLLATLCAVAAAALGIALLVFLPTMISFVGLSAYSPVLINTLSIILLVVVVGGTIALLYRYGPSRRPPFNQHIFAGAVLATVLWLISSAALSFYVSHIASFGATYGSLGAVVAIMLWFYTSTYAVLLGAELNAQLEQAGTDSGAAR